MDGDEKTNAQVAEEQVAEAEAEVQAPEAPVENTEAVGDEAVKPQTEEATE